MNITILLTYLSVLFPHSWTCWLGLWRWIAFSGTIVRPLIAAASRPPARQNKTEQAQTHRFVCVPFCSVFFFTGAQAVGLRVSENSGTMEAGRVTDKHGFRNVDVFVSYLCSSFLVRLVRPLFPQPATHAQAHGRIIGVLSHVVLPATTDVL